MIHSYFLWLLCECHPSMIFDEWLYEKLTFYILTLNDIRRLTYTKQYFRGHFHLFFFFHLELGQFKIYSRNYHKNGDHIQFEMGKSRVNTENINNKSRIVPVFLLKEKSKSYYIHFFQCTKLYFSVIIRLLSHKAAM